ncbi:LysR family transcriptional regulator [Halomonas sp. YLGW01]|uniref:LysR family transcriptional regulator n=1 Tax=Halomonas sp. YLGW01 TaxID=2773308 RepID=UPI001785973E|nr:LysR family transcriptional regulator [Halomonas sp. YLGW01]
MELRWLEDFIALARTRHFSRAADEQNVTQPTFSRRIKLLEEEMGTTLINRQTLPLSLTPAGEEFLALCEQTTDRIRLTRERIARLNEVQSRRLLLAAPQGLLSYFLPAWLEQQAPDPPIQLNLRATSWLVPDYFQALERGECDLAVSYWPVGRSPLELDTQAFEYKVIGHERLVPLTVPDGFGRPRFTLPSERRAPQPLIAYHAQGLMQATIDDHLARLPERCHFNVLAESVQSGNVRELVCLGHGLGWVPEGMVREDLSAKRLMPAGDAPWSIPLEVRLYRHREARQSGLEQFWSTVDTSTC